MVFTERLWPHVTGSGMMLMILLVLNMMPAMELYKKELARTLAETGALFFDRNLVLKDGRPTPYFVNTAKFNTGRLSLKLGSFFAGMMAARGLAEKTDILLGPSYKGSALALAASIALWQEYGVDLLYDYDRKEAKTHGEASRSRSLFVNGTFFDGCRVFVVDDVATSMGTKYELVEKVRGEAEARGIEIEIVGIGISIDREQTAAVYGKDGKVVPDKKGKDAIRDFEAKSGIPVYAVAGIREVVAHLYAEGVPVLIRGESRPMDPETKAEFDRYIEIYGVA